MRFKSLAFCVALCAVPVLFLSSCSRPEPTEEEVAAPLSPPSLGYGANPVGGVSNSPTAASAGGSTAGGMQYLAGRSGGPMPEPVVGAPTGDQINVDNGNRMSPTTTDAAEGDSSSGSGDGPTNSGNIPPNVDIVPPGYGDVPPGATGATKEKVVQSSATKAINASSPEAPGTKAAKSLGGKIVNAPAARVIGA